jgi:hypothetical protein
LAEKGLAAITIAPSRCLITIEVLSFSCNQSPMALNYLCTSLSNIAVSSVGSSSSISGCVTLEAKDAELLNDGEPVDVAETA